MIATILNVSFTIAAVAFLAYNVVRLFIFEKELRLSQAKLDENVSELIRLAQPYIAERKRPTLRVIKGGLTK